MTDHPYKKFIEEEELILRDVLATDRTILANERTFLAYLKTAITMFIGGVTLIKLFPAEPFLYTAGELVVPLSLGIIIFGYFRFAKKHETLSRVIARLENKVEKRYNLLHHVGKYVNIDKNHFMNKIRKSFLTLRRAS